MEQEEVPEKENQEEEVPVSKSQITLGSFIDRLRRWVSFVKLYTNKSRPNARPIVDVTQILEGDRVIIVPEGEDLIIPRLEPLASLKADQEESKEEEDTEETSTATSSTALRSPICCVLGHVDTGKTSLLDKIRATNVQSNEAGGITQQIGASFFPIETIAQETQAVNQQFNFQLKVPGLLVIDTPGHESFSNLRTRGSSLCDVAVLVVDIMHGLEPQTIESINILKNGKIPFVIALNKIDRIYQWQSDPQLPIPELLKNQTKEVLAEFHQRLEKITEEFATHKVKVKPYYRNKDFHEFLPIVPTSAITGEVVLAQTYLSTTLLKSPQLQCSVLEVKGDTLLLSSARGPLYTRVRSILSPQPLKELREKGEAWETLQSVEGVRADLETVDGGSKVIKVKGATKKSREEALSHFEDHHKRNVLSTTGVYVQSSSQGSLEALLSFLRESDVPVSGTGIGPLKKKQVMQARSHDPMYRLILAFDIAVPRSMVSYCVSQGVSLFQANIIYNLFDAFKEHVKVIRKRTVSSGANLTPAILTIIPERLYKLGNPLLITVRVKGELRMNQLLCIPQRKFLEIGRVTSIQIPANRTPDNEEPEEPIEWVTVAHTFSGLARIKVQQEVNQSQKLVLLNRDWEFVDQIYTKMQSLGQMTESWRMNREENWEQFLDKYKRTFGFNKRH